MPRSIQAGSALKAGGGKLTINFPRPFKRIPVVVVTPYWRDAGSGVGYVETIDEIYLESFTVISGNAAPNYFVNWIAFVDDDD